MNDLIIMTPALSIGVALLLWVTTRDLVVAVFLAAFGTSATIPLFFHLKYDFGFAWLIWIICVIAAIFYLGKKYPDKMKKWEKHF